MGYAHLMNTTPQITEPVTLTFASVPTGEVHVHRYQCRDLQVSPEYRRADLSTLAVVNTMEAIVTEWWADIIDENSSDWTHYVDDVKVFPCVKLAK